MSNVKQCDQCHKVYAPELVTAVSISLPSSTLPCVPKVSGFFVYGESHFDFCEPPCAIGWLEELVKAQQ